MAYCVYSYLLLGGSVGSAPQGTSQRLGCGLRAQPMPGLPCQCRRFFSCCFLPSVCSRALLVIIIIILWDKNVVLLKQSREVLADERPDVEKGDHDGEDAEQAEGHFHRLRQNGAAAGNDD